MDRLGEGLFGYWLPVAHATLLGGMDVAGNLLENVGSAVAARRRQRQRQRQQQDAGTENPDEDDPRTVNGAPVVDLSGHVAIVTGGNAGIGLTSARKLAERGATVIIATRDARRGADAAQLLRAAAARPLPGCQPGAVEDARLDLSSLDSVRSFARQFNASGRPLSLLLCNAGVMSPPERRSTSDGLELQLQTNAIGHFLLAHELLAHQRRQRRARATSGGGSGSGSAGAAAVAGAAADAATERPPPSTLALAPPGRGTRVVVLSSLTHHAGPAQWSDKQSLQRYGPFVSYALSKLAGVVWAVEMQRRFDAHHRGRRGAGAGGGGEEQAEDEKQKQQKQQQAPWWDGCPGRPSCSGCVVCEAEEVEEEKQGGRRGRGGSSSSAHSVLFGRDTAISLHPGIVATGLATGFFDRTAAAIAGSSGGGGGGATESAADAAASALAADAVAVAPVSSSSPSANSSPLAPLLERLYPWLLRSPEAAADGVLRACLAADDNAAGAYWHNGKPARASKFARDARRGAELWDYAVALCGAETDESLSK